MLLAVAVALITAASAWSPRKEVQAVQLRAVPETRVCPKCTQPRRVGRLPAHLEEISGLAASTQHEGVFYAVVDSPEVPQVFVLKESGELLQTLNLSGAAYPDSFDFGSTHQGDWEAAATGPCLLKSKDMALEPSEETSHGQQGAAGCVFIGDIGHNCARPSAHCSWRRDRYRILQIREPADFQEGQLYSTVEAHQAWFKFPNDEAFDVESLMAAPDGQLYVATKEDSGISHFFHISITDEASSATPVSAKPLGQIEVPELKEGRKVTHVPRGTAWVTGASMVQYQGNRTGFSLRTPKHVLFYSLDNGSDVSGAITAQVPCELPTHMFPQSESVTWEKQHGVAYYLTSENSRDLYKVDCGAGAESGCVRVRVWAAFGCISVFAVFLF